MLSFIQLLELLKFLLDSFLDPFIIQWGLIYYTQAYLLSVGSVVDT